MDRDRWRQTEQIFQSALERSPEERDAFLSEACGDNTELRQEVELLLREPLAPSAPDQSGGSSFGPYRIVERIGAGGMGEVFRAVDTRLSRTVAVKVVHAALASDAIFQRRFEREARACSALNHPHICGVYDIGDQDGVQYLVMEYVSGETLAARLGKGPLPFSAAVEYGIQIGEALAAAHGIGIVHRDLKPANIMLTTGGVKVLDFGLAKFSHRKHPSSEETATMTDPNPVAGTPAYMAPEQLEGKECDWRSDIFALGLVLHEMVSGTRAFAAENYASWIAEVLRGRPAPLSGVPPQFARVVSRCLMRDPAQRWQSVSDVVLELRESLSPAPVPSVRRPWLPVACAWTASLLIAGWLGATLFHDPATVPLSAYRLTPFAASQPVQANPLWSPDGRKIAYVGQQDNHRAMFVQSLESSTAVAATASDIDVTAFFPGFWTPDSQFLYFSGTRVGEGGLFRVPAGGGDAALVQPDVLRGTISPDGRTLVTLAQAPDGLHILTATPPGAAPRPYLPVPFEAGQWKGRPFLSFAPDGRKMLVVLDTERRREAWLLPWPPGRGVRVLERTMLGPAPQFAWMPDSRHVVVSAAVPASHAQLYMADLTSGGIWKILAQDRPVVHASVSPDGARVAYQSSLSHSEVVAVPLDGRPARTLLGGSRSHQMADHSSAARQLVYITDRRGVSEVWITSVSDNWDRLLLSPGDVEVDSERAVGFAAPVFSRDGRRVAVVAVSPVGGAIYTTPASGTMPVRVTSQSNPSEYAPTWSPDGKWLAFWHIAGKQIRLAKVQPGSGHEPADLADCWNRTVPAWSPAGDWIAYHDPGSQLALVSPDGTQHRALGGTGAIAWSPDGKTIYQARSDTRRLVAVDPATGKERVLRDLADMVPYASQNAGWRASLTPDAAEFVYTINHPREEIWILDGIRAPAPWYRRWLQ